MVQYLASSAQVTVTVEALIVETILSAEAQPVFVKQSQPFSVFGQLSRITGEPIPSMTVTFSGGTQGTLTTTTDGSGLFGFYDLVEMEAGVYTYTLDFAGGEFAGLTFTPSSTRITPFARAGPVNPMLIALLIAGYLLVSKK